MQVSLFFYSYLIQTEVSFLLYSYFYLLPSAVFVNPNDSDSLKVTLLLQMPLLAYGDG